MVLHLQLQEHLSLAQVVVVVLETQQQDQAVQAAVEQVLFLVALLMQLLEL
jgi:hypothetical protein